MNENDNNFEALQRLLALKRHETPPPGYFNDFSSSVMARLKAGQMAQRKGLPAQLGNEAPWLIKFLRIFEAKPAFAGGFAAALCLLLFGGIVYNNEHDVTSPDSSILSAVMPSVPAATSMASVQPTSLSIAANPAEQAGGLAVTTNYSLQPVGAMFGQQNFFTQPQPASFSLSGN